MPAPQNVSQLKRRELKGRLVVNDWLTKSGQNLPPAQQQQFAGVQTGSQVQLSKQQQNHLLHMQGLQPHEAPPPKKESRRKSQQH